MHRTHSESFAWTIVNHCVESPASVPGAEEVANYNSVLRCLGSRRLRCAKGLCETA